MKDFDKIIGIIGGGQLGKMLIESTRKWNINYHILDVENAPSKHLAKKHIIGGLKDSKAIKELSSGVDVLTYEIEHIDIETLAQLEKEGKEVIPSSSVLQIINDKGIQKQFYKENGIASSNFVFADSPKEWEAGSLELKGEKVVIKSRTGGYDGKGVKVVSKKELTSTKIQEQFDMPCILEECIDFEKELAVIVVVDNKQNTLCYPAVEMEFHPVANLVEFLFAPAIISQDIEEKAKDLAIETALALDSPGLFAVEMFLTKDGAVLVNETAPRPHNSGHHTIEGCVTSQYEQLNRILLNLPLGDTALRRPTAMINIIGAESVYGAYNLENIDVVLAMKGVHLHMYNKAETKPYRKLGHVTIEEDSIEALKEKAKKVLSLLKVINA